MSTLGSLAVSIIGDMRGLNKAFDESQQRLKTFGQSMQRVGDSMVGMGRKASLYVTAPIVGAFTVATKGAAELEGAIAKFDVVFGEFAEEMHEWVASYRREFPLANREIIKHSAALQDLLVPMGLGREEAKDMTQDWLFLAGALSAFNDVPIEQALDAIRSGIAGQTQPLRQFGINANVAALEQTAIKNGLMEAGDAMTDQVRQQALLIQAYQQSADAVDGLEEQKGSLLWAMQEMKATLKDVGDSFGQILIPYVMRAVEWIQKLMVRFREMDPRVQKIITVVALVAAAIGPLLIALGLMAKGIGVVSVAFSALSLPVLAIIAVIVGLILVFRHLWRTNEEFRDRVIAVWERVRSFIVIAMAVIREVISVALEWIQDFWDEWGEEIMASVSSIFGKIWEVVSKVLELLMVYWMWVFEKIQVFWDKWGDKIMLWWSFVWDTIWNVLKTAWEIIEGVVGGVLDSISGLLDIFIGAFTGDWEKMWDGLARIVRGVANTMISIVNGVIGAFERMVNAIARAINNIPSIKIPDWLGGGELSLPKVNEVELPRVPMLKRGTNLIPKDMLAFLHEGEAVVPKKYNPALAGGFQGGFQVDHTGTITVQGVNSDGEFMGAVELVLEGLNNIDVKRKLDQIGAENVKRRTQPKGGRVL